jgi:2-oxoglutarate ferredoxin oxidoreductase subunit beta
MGSVDRPLNPCAFAMGCDATFIARSLDRDPTHLKEILHRAHKHRGTSFLEIYQNCNIFNDGAFFVYTEKESKPTTALFVENGKPLVFGTERSKGIMLKDMRPVIVDLNNGVSENDLWIHDETDIFKATMLTRFFDNPANAGALPRPFGVLYAIDQPCYEDLLFSQIDAAVAQKGEGDLDALIAGTRTWTIS